MNQLVIVSIVALVIERILELLDWLRSYFYSFPQQMNLAFTEKIDSFKQRTDKFKEVLRQDIMRIKDGEVSDEDLANIISTSCGFSQISDDEMKELLILWREYEEKREKIANIKMIIMWFFALALSLAFVQLFDFRLMDQMGIAMHNYMDKFMTAIVLGSGTKPVHDVISILKHKKK